MNPKYGTKEWLAEEHEYTPFAKFIFSIIKVDEHLIDAVASYRDGKNANAPSCGVLMSVTDYKLQAGSLGEGYLEIGNSINAPQLMDLFFKDGFVEDLFKKRTYARNALNPLHDVNPPRSSKTIEENICYFFQRSQKSFSDFLDDCQEQMEMPGGLFSKLSPNEESAFYDYICAKFKEEFSDTNYLPSSLLNLLDEEETKDGTEIMRGALGKMLVILLIFYALNGRSEDYVNYSAIFSELMNYQSPAKRENISGESEFSSHMFQGLSGSKNDISSLLEQIKIDDRNLIIIGEGGAGKSKLTAEICRALNASEIGNCDIPMANGKKLHISAPASFGTARYIKLKDLEHDLSLSKKIYDNLRGPYDEPASFGHASEALIDFINSHDNMKKLVVILDGFNEISSDRQKSLINEIKILGIKENYKRAANRPCFIISSRPGYGNDLTDSVGKKLYLLSLTSNTVEKYVSRHDNLKKYRNALAAHDRNNLDKLLSSPLLLNFFVKTYENTNCDEIPRVLNQCVLFDSACEQFVNNLAEDQQNYARFSYKLLLPSAVSDNINITNDGERARFVSKWLNSLIDNKNENFLTEFKPDQSLKYDSADGRIFRNLLLLLRNHLSNGQADMHEMLEDYFKAKDIMNECLYSNTPFEESGMQELIKASTTAMVGDALKYWQRAIMLVQMSEEKCNFEVIGDKNLPVYMQFSDEYRRHWPKFVFEVFNFIDTLREDSTLMLNHFFLLEPEERTEGKDGYALTKLDEYIKNCFDGDKQGLYERSVFYNSTAYIITRIPMDSVPEAYLQEHGFANLLDFKKRTVPSLLNTAEGCINEYLKHSDEIEAKQEAVAYLQKAKVINNMAGYYQEMYKVEPDADVQAKYASDIHELRVESLSIKKEICLPKYEALLDNKAFENLDNKYHLFLFTSIADSYTAMGTDQYYYARQAEEKGDYADAFAKYSIAIERHTKAKDFRMQARDTTLVNDLRIIGCEIRQNLLIDEIKKDKRLQGNNSLTPHKTCEQICAELLPLILTDKEVHKGIERNALRDNIFSLGLFHEGKDAKLTNAIEDLIRRYEPIYLAYFTYTEDRTNLLDEIKEKKEDYAVSPTEKKAKEKEKSAHSRT